MASSIPDKTYAIAMTDAMRQHFHQRTVDNCCQYLVAHLDCLAAAKPALRILDVGCGPGFLTVDIALRYPQATVIGVDREEGTTAIATARAHAEARGARNCTFQAADAHDLESAFPRPQERDFDVVHAHQVLEHVADPVRVLAQMRAVARPAGGLVAVRTIILENQITYPPNQWGTCEWRRLQRAIGPLEGMDLDAGAKQHAWARAAGFDMTPRGADDASSQPGCVVSFHMTAFKTPEALQAMSVLGAAQVQSPQFKDVVLRKGLATEEEVKRISDSLLEWGKQKDALQALPHGDLLLFV